MKTFANRTWDAASFRLCTATPSSAQDLVTQTLARHGLSSGLTADAAIAPTGAFHDMTARLRPTQPQNKAADPPLPEGSQFLEGHFACEAGSRSYRTYVPAAARSAPLGMIVMLHGCTQTPEDFAAGTGMNALAERHGFIVVYPHQSRGENAQSCWNWFRRGDQRRARGEPAILSGIAIKIASEHAVPTDRIFVAGLSAGAAMAVILGETYPDVFSGVGAHSGLPAGCAKDVLTAFAAMAGNGTVATSRDGASPTRTIIMHGTSDNTVHPSNGEQIARHARDLGPRQTIETEERGHTGGRAYSRKLTAQDKGPTLVEEWKIEGLGHAWSGGCAQGTYTDAHGPDASAAMVRFFFDEPEGRT